MPNKAVMAVVVGAALAVAGLANAQQATPVANKAVLSLDGVIALAGGIPLIESGRLIGAIGCAGGTSAQDEPVSTVGAATINR